MFTKNKIKGKFNMISDNDPKRSSSTSDLKKVTASTRVSPTSGGSGSGGELKKPNGTKKKYKELDPLSMSFSGWLFSSLAPLGMEETPFQPTRVLVSTWGDVLERTRDRYLQHWLPQLELSPRIDPQSWKMSAPRCSVCAIGLSRFATTLKTFKERPRSGSPSKSNENSSSSDGGGRDMCMIQRNCTNTTGMTSNKDILQAIINGTTNAATANLISKKNKETAATKSDQQTSTSKGVLPAVPTIVGQEAVGDTENENDSPSSGDAEGINSLTSSNSEKNSDIDDQQQEDLEMKIQNIDVLHHGSMGGSGGKVGEYCPVPMTSCDRVDRVEQQKSSAGKTQSTLN